MYDPEARESITLMKLDYIPSGLDVFFTSIPPSMTPYVLLSSEQSLSEAQVTDPSRFVV